LTTTAIASPVADNSALVAAAQVVPQQVSDLVSNKLRPPNSAWILRVVFSKQIFKSPQWSLDSKQLFSFLCAPLVVLPLCPSCCNPKDLVQIVLAEAKRQLNATFLANLGESVNFDEYKNWSEDLANYLLANFPMHLQKHNSATGR
jgi:hypothetical protein